MIQIPVIKIKKILDGLLAYIKADTEANVLDETKSYLYRILHDNQDGDYNIYQQAKTIFTRESTSPKRINTSLFFTKNIQQIPHIFVRESLELPVFPIKLLPVGHPSYLVMTIIMIGLGLILLDNV